MIDLWYIFDLLAQQEGDGSADELFKSPSGVTFRPEELFSTRIKAGLHTHPVFCKVLHFALQSFHFAGSH